MSIRWDETFRIISSRYPFVGIYDRISDPADIDAVIELERLTNDRVRDEAGDISLVAAADRIAGPGSTPIMAAFTHTRPSRFSDGSFGVYYAARVIHTAVAETIFHVERFLRSTREASTDVDMRVYVARVFGTFDDLRSIDRMSSLLDPDSYTASQHYAKALRGENDVDGIVYDSVRDALHRECVACFRPRTISSCRPQSYLTYRWDGPQQRIIDTFHRESFTGNP